MASKPLKGYKRLKGSPRRYLTPSGQEITEYEYRSRKARRVKGNDGKSLFKNYSQQRRFRQTQKFQRLRFQIRSIDPDILVDAGSDLEAAIVELTHHPDFGKSGVFGPEGEAEPIGRFADLLNAIGAPDYYFWRFWYSETRAG